MVNNNL